MRKLLACAVIICVLLISGCGETEDKAGGLLIKQEKTDEEIMLPKL